MKNFKFAMFLLLTGLFLSPPGGAQDNKKTNFDKLRTENVLAVGMTDEQIGFYLDESQWPESIPAAKRAEYSKEKLNLRIVHIDSYLSQTSILPHGATANSWYETPLITSIPLRNFTTAKRYPSSFTAGSMYNPIYVNMVSPSQPGGNWSTGVTLNHMRF